MNPARVLAFEILRLVERGAHSTDLLRARTAALEARDAALASELVLGVLRRQAQIDYLIAVGSGRETAKLDREVLWILRLGAYQLRYLDRVPRHAAVHESVELVKRARKRSAAGLVNAVLRRIGREPVAWPDRATEFCLPAWLLESWEKQYGAEAAARAASAALDPPPLFVRVPPGREQEAPAWGLEPEDVAGCYRAGGAYAGPFRVQDIGSQWAAAWLEALPGQWLLDLCAAPGNKTSQSLERALTAVACDISLRRLREMPERGCYRVALDGERDLPFARRFDRVLVDAPCSGTGTLARNPEIRWRVQPADLVRHQRRQVRLLQTALAALAPGGRLVYSTCSLEREENECVVEEVMSGWGPAARVQTMARRLPGRDAGDGFFAAVITSE